MAEGEWCILTNMCMIYSGNKVLVQEKRSKLWNGLTFPGGHVERGESFVDSVIREVKEETGLDISDVEICGIKQWTQENSEYRYIVLFYKTNKFSGELKSSSEGEAFWIDRADFDKYTLAEGFSEMLEVFMNDSLTENYLWYENGEWLAVNK